MSDEILDRIRCAVFEFHKYNRIQPTSVYLGHKEYAEIRAMADCSLLVVGRNIEAFGCKVFGCKVYEVNQPTHFHVC